MKKGIMMRGLALALVLCIGCMIPQKTVSANEKGNNISHEHSPTAQVTVKNLDTGEVHILSEKDGINVETKIDENGKIVTGVSAKVAIPSEGTGIMPYVTATDTGKTVRVQLDLEYEMSGSNYRMTRAYGSFKRLDSSFSMTGKYIILANYHHAESRYTKEYTNPPDTFSYRPFTNWVDTTYKPVSIAGYAKCITSRGDYRYEVRCDVVVIGDKLL